MVKTGKKTTRGDFRVNMGSVLSRVRGGSARCRGFVWLRLALRYYGPDVRLLATGRGDRAAAVRARLGGWSRRPLAHAVGRGRPREPKRRCPRAIGDVRAGKAIAADRHRLRDFVAG